MSFLVQESNGGTFINIKLTDFGRRALSLGGSRGFGSIFAKAVFSDREINYSIDRSNTYNILNNRIIAPKDFAPFFTTNFDGSDAVALGSNGVTSAKQFTTAHTTTAGFFTGITHSFAINSNKLSKTPFNTLTYTTSLPSGGTTVRLDNTSSGTFPNAGDLLFIPWEPVQNSGKTYASNTNIFSGNPTVSLWYRVTSTSGPYVNLDRPTPNFGSASATAQKVNVYVYPFNGVEQFYGSAATVDSQVWNMNVIRTSSVEGTTGMTGSQIVSGYTSYGSIEYNGAKNYFGFSAETPIFGVIHYTNEFTGNTYAEQLIEKTVKLTLPTLMWHNFGSDNGQGQDFGVTLQDVDGDTIFDSIAGTTYRFLKDGVASTSKIVGRAYHKLRMFIITDAELLTAMTYKSNRNYTLPGLNLSLSPNPKFPLTKSQASGLTQSGFSYFVTYIPESFSAYTKGRSFGYPAALHCTDIQKIDGQNDVNGNPQFLVANFPSNSFPYLRSSANTDANSAFSGTGWNTNSVQLLINEQSASAGFSIGNVPTLGWKRVSAVVGNGIYTGETGDTTIDPLKLAGFSFIVSRQDFNSGSTYVLNTALTLNQDYKFSNGLNFGNESFFYGNVDVDILATTYKTFITTFAKNDEFNSSLNKSFDDLLDEQTYITEIGILDADNNLVAVGKPTYPIRKSDGRFLGFQLEIDF